MHPVFDYDQAIQYCEKKAVYLFRVMHQLYVCKPMPDITENDIKWDPRLGNDILGKYAKSRTTVKDQILIIQCVVATAGVRRLEIQRDAELARGEHLAIESVATLLKYIQTVCTWGSQSTGRAVSALEALSSLEGIKRDIDLDELVEDYNRKGEEPVEDRKGEEPVEDRKGEEPVEDCKGEEPWLQEQMDVITGLFLTWTFLHQPVDTVPIGKLPPKKRRARYDEIRKTYGLWQWRKTALEETLTRNNTVRTLLGRETVCGKTLRKELHDAQNKLKKKVMEARSRCVGEQTCEYSATWWDSYSQNDDNGVSHTQDIQPNAEKTVTSNNTGAGSVWREPPFPTYKTLTKPPVECEWALKRK